MTGPLFDMDALAQNRARARRAGNRAMFLQEMAADQLLERLAEVNRTFTSPAVITAFPDLWRDRLPDARIVAEADMLDLPPQSHDLVLHVLSMHWANDPVGQLIQSRRALRPDGLFLGVIYGGRTLNELRSALAEAESRIRGGLSPRVAPMAELRDLGGLLQRAGYALPVADSDILNVSYADLPALIRDLRAMGETSALAARPRHFARRALFEAAADLYRKHFPSADNRLSATFEMIYLTGWAPDESQQKPLRPGSATTRLAEALGTAEFTTGDPTGPKPDHD
ncbi:MAG: methyltransferase domain-containing protein [Rhodobacteraceae bacterium]|nr:methyltransferase domain-containing protein [Paracoccaceae bacterium]